jgi:hypothetical protein
MVRVVAMAMAMAMAMEMAMAMVVPRAGDMGESVSESEIKRQSTWIGIVTEYCLRCRHRGGVGIPHGSSKRDGRMYME